MPEGFPLRDRTDVRRFRTLPQDHDQPWYAGFVTGWSLPHQQGVAEAVGILKGKWTITVMAALALDERQNKDILAAVNNGSNGRAALSPRVLADTLQRATEDGLIERNAEEGMFGAVRYRLTTKGRALLRAIFPLAEWAVKYHGPARTS